uniref:Uncharacterized protein n=1 Tax=Oryza sativa subsp. japonica TaxID=39947 RepID=Q6YTI8_ORYSJ|nr:hypothetical protein [Oryza sativa Japonica Group]BAD17749.1 hypothetical protein [Oryza sativa Japonica Group]
MDGWGSAEAEAEAAAVGKGKLTRWKLTGLQYSLTNGEVPAVAVAAKAEARRHVGRQAVAKKMESSSGGAREKQSGHYGNGSSDFGYKVTAVQLGDISR